MLPGRHIALTAAVALACLAWAGPGAVAAPSAPDPAGPACADARCAADAVRALLAEGRAREAVDAAKRFAAVFPEDASLPTLLGAAYLAAENPMWAIRTLSARLAAAPEDCEARTWLARAFLDTGATDQAAEALDGGDCPADAPVAVRRAMLHAVAAPDDAPRHLLAARRGRSAWDAERAALPGLTRRLDPDATPDLAWRLEGTAGWSSNPRMGSPTDAAGTGTRGGSAMAGLDLWVRAAPDLGAVARPVAEAQARLSWLFAGDVEDLSYLQLAGRLGVQFRSLLPRVTLSYRPDWLLLPMGFRNDPDPVSFSVGHRGEVEVETGRWVTVFAGAGRRIFRELPRTRTEVDLGLGGRVPLGRVGNLIWAGAGRAYRARHAAYHLWGGSLALSAQFRIPKGFLARLGTAFSVDWYPDSAGRPGNDLFGSADARRDLFFKVGAAFFSPDLRGVRLGVGYDFSDRESTASRYAFDDHRVLVRVAWSGDAGLTGPAAAPGGPAAPMPWEAGDGARGLEERVQDLLRQDEQVQRSSSCVQ